MSQAAVRAELEKVLASNAFRGSESLKRFLRYAVEHTIQGEGDQLKEYRLGVDVLDRPASFDPRLDPAVRMAARRLRAKLREYYDSDGRQDPVWIDIPKGGYAAAFANSASRELARIPKSASNPRRLRLIALVTVAVLGAIALAGGYRWRSKAEAAVHARRSVAVLGFENLSGRPDKAWLSTALSEMLTTELAAGEQLRTVPGENVAQMKINLALPDADSYGRDTLAKIHNNLNADDVVLGSYILLGDGQVRLDLRLQDTAAGETLASVSEKGSEAEIDDLVGRAGASLRARLGVQAVSDAQAAAVKASLPSNAQAAQLYFDGLAKTRKYDNLGARDALEKALAIEPSYAPAHAALAATWANLGYDPKAREEAKKAFDLSANLRSADRLWIEAHYREMTDELDKAVEIYRNLFDTYPDNLEYGERLAYVQYHAGKGQDAMATIDQLRKLPPPARDDPRLDIREADAGFALGDYKRYQEASARGAEKARAQGARLLAAQALADDCWGLKLLGRPKEAITTCEEAQRIFAAANDRDYVAAVLNQIGVIFEEQGDLVTARSKIEEALAISREVGDRDGTASELGNLANILDAQGEVNEAKRLFEQILAMFREVGDKAGGSAAQADVGRMLARLGDLSGARSNLEESLAITRETGDKGQEGVDLSELGDVLYSQGDLASAVGVLQQAESDLRQAGDKKGEAYGLSNLGKVFAARGDLAGARAKYQQALNIRRDLGASQETAQSQVMLADLAIEEGHPADAQAPCRQAIEAFRAEKAADSEILAHTVLAHSLLAMGKRPDAQKEIDLARDLAAKSQDFGIRVRSRIIAARVSAGLRNGADAERMLQAAFAESVKRGFVPLELESRLVLGEIETESGRTGSGRSHLAALEREATSRGFSLVASKAAAASVRVPAGPTRHRSAHARLRAAGTHRTA
ncbi:MAG: tetratricopeptide repeat protein [Acidobacteriia bacterium]|nr:tetratricopeptide repeat protein [Terriglobia bacterium]